MPGGQIIMTSSNGNIFRVTGPFVGGIHRSPMDSPHKGQWRGALMFSLIRTWKKRLSKQSRRLRCETPSQSLSRPCNVHGTSIHETCLICGMQMRLWNICVRSINYINMTLRKHQFDGVNRNPVLLCQVSPNGVSPVRSQAIIWTNAEILLTGPWGTNCSEIFIEIHTFSFKKIH